MATKISKKDWDEVTQFILDELEARKTSKAREKHKKIWAEVDRQVSMELFTRSLFT